MKINIKKSYTRNRDLESDLRRLYSINLSLDVTDEEHKIIEEHIQFGYEFYLEIFQIREKIERPGVIKKRALKFSDFSRNRESQIVEYANLTFENADAVERLFRKAVKIFSDRLEVLGTFQFKESL